MKRVISAVLGGLFLAVFTVTPAMGQTISTEKRAEIEKLLELTGALNIGQQFSAMMVNQLANVLRSSHPDLPQKAIDVLPEEVNAVIANNIDSFKELMIEVYDRHYTLEDIKGLNQFYSSELGRKVTSTLPSVLQDSMAAGEQWGKSLGPELNRRIRARFKKEDIAI